MWLCLFLASLIFLQTHAFAPAQIRWARIPARRFYLAPSAMPNGVSASIPDSVPVAKLTIQDLSSKLPSSKIPHFTANPDETISWDGSCLQASGDTVLVSPCTGERSQLWSFLPQGLGRTTRIQGKGTNSCLDVAADGALTGATVELRDCDHRASELWEFERTVAEEPISFPTRDLQRSPFSSFVSHAMMSTIMFALLGALTSTAWVWQWHRKQKQAPTQRGPLLKVDQGGVCLTESLAKPQFTPSSQTGGHEMVAAAMMVSPVSEETTGSPEIKGTRPAVAVTVKRGDVCMFDSAHDPVVLPHNNHQKEKTLEASEGVVYYDVDDVDKDRPKMQSSTLPSLRDYGFEDRTRIGTLDVPCLGFGTIAWGTPGFGGLVESFEQSFLKIPNAVNSAEAVVLAAKLKGIDLFDTAERYGYSVSTSFGLGYGETESLIRRTLEGIEQKAVVATKFTPTPTRTKPEDVVLACEGSLKRLGVDVIDLYQLQIPDIVQPWARIPFLPKEWSKPKDEIYWEGLVECYKRGLVLNIGVSNYGPTLLRRAHAYFKSKGVPLASNQINYSLLYRKSGAQATVDVCKELGISVLAYFPLGMGALTGKWKTESTDTQTVSGKSSLEQADIEAASDQAAPLLEALSTVAKARGKTQPQVALNWVMCKGAVPIPGVRTAKQAIENAGALGWRLTKEEVEYLERAADAVETEFTGAGFKRSNSKFVGYGFEVWTLD